MTAKTVLRDLFVPEWPPRWPVPADLLFERVRNVDYMVISTSIILMGWLYFVLLNPREKLALGDFEWNEEFSGFKPLYWLVYSDCNKDEHAQRQEAADGVNVEHRSEFSARGENSCAGLVSGGFVYEIMWASLVNFMDMTLVQMVNNPWRSKLWALPALGIIVFNIINWGKLVVNELTDTDVGDAEIPILTVSRKMFYGVFAVAWLSLLYLLVKLLVKDDFNGERQKESIQYTRRLLISRTPDESPSMFQDFANGLAASCPKEDLTSCAQAAIKRRSERVADRSRPKELPLSTAQKILQLFRGAPTEQEVQVAHMSVSMGMHGTASTGSQAYERARGTATASTHRVMTEPVRNKPAKVFKTLDKLPSLARVSLMLSVLLSLLAATGCILGATILRLNSDAFVEALVTSATNLRESAVQGIEQAQAANATVNMELDAMELTTMEVVNGASSLAAGGYQLEQLQALLTNPDVTRVLEDAANAAAANQNWELYGQLQQLAGAGPALNATLANFDFNQYTSTVYTLYGQFFSVAGTVRAGLQSVVQASYEVQTVVGESNKHLLFGADWLRELSYSVRRTIVISVCAGLIVALTIVEWTRRSWRKIRDDIKIGEVRKSADWNPSNFDPVKAPTLPGLMASSIAFAFLSVAIALFLFLEVIWMGWYSGFTIPWKTIETLALGAGTSVLLKVLVLDKMARAFLTNNGFVTRWIFFAWYVTLLLPFYAITSIIAAIFRFIVLAAVGFANVAAVHVTLLPPVLASFDPAYVASMSMLVMSHRHNSPINMSFAQAFQGEQVGHPLKKTRAQKNWKFAVTLARNPELTQMRAHEELDLDGAASSQMPNSVSLTVPPQSVAPAGFQSAQEEKSNGGSNGGAMIGGIQAL
jgi:hypothetical protein